MTLKFRTYKIQAPKLIVFFTENTVKINTFWLYLFSLYLSLSLSLERTRSHAAHTNLSTHG